MNIKQLLTELASEVGIGHRKDVYKIVRKYLESFALITETNNYILAEINNNSDYTIMLEAHIDEVGMIVTDILDDGFLLVSPIGSLDGRFLPATPVKVFGSKTVYGTFTSIPPHIKNSDSCPDFESCYIDTGMLNIGEIISLGDVAVFDAEPIYLTNSRLTSKALDNRSGVAAVIAAGKKLAEADCPVNVKLLFPMGEELGLRGARVGAFGVSVGENVSVDVSFGDCPDVPAHKTAKLGSGAMIGVSPVLCRDIYKKLEQTAKDNNIPHTLEVMGGTTSTDADIISLSGSGIPSGLVSIPLRNMHTPAEIIDISDVESASELLYKYVMGGGLNG